MDIIYRVQQWIQSKLEGQEEDIRVISGEDHYRHTDNDIMELVRRPYSTISYYSIFLVLYSTCDCPKPG
jgi:hypothetical protein